MPRPDVHLPLPNSASISSANFSWPRSDKSRILSLEFKAKLVTVTVGAAFTAVSPAMGALDFC